MFSNELFIPSWLQCTKCMGILNQLNTMLSSVNNHAQPHNALLTLSTHSHFVIMTYIVHSENLLQETLHKTYSNAVIHE